MPILPAFSLNPFFFMNIYVTFFVLIYIYLIWSLQYLFFKLKILLIYVKQQQSFFFFFKGSNFPLMFFLWNICFRYKLDIYVIYACWKYQKNIWLEYIIYILRQKYMNGCFMHFKLEDEPHLYTHIQCRFVDSFKKQNNIYYRV